MPTPGEVDLPGFGPAADGVPGVEPDEVVAYEGEGEQGGRRGEAGHPDEAAIDAQGLVAGRAEESFDEGAAVEGLGLRSALPRQRLPVAFVVGVLDGDGLAAAARLALEAGGRRDGMRHPHRGGRVGAPNPEWVPIDGRSAEALCASLRVVLAVGAKRGSVPSPFRVPSER